jgi:hypothetical protein
VQFHQTTLDIIKEDIRAEIMEHFYVRPIEMGQGRNKEGIRSAVIVIFNVKNY